MMKNTIKTKEDVVEEIKYRVDNELKMSSSSTEDRNLTELRKQAKILFGTWEDAINNSGYSSYESKDIISGVYYKKLNIIKEIREMYVNGESLVVSKVDSNLHQRAIRYFGSWETVLRKSGLTDKDFKEMGINFRRRFVTKKDVQDYIQERYKKGKGFRQVDLRKDDEDWMYQRVLTIYGTWEDALRDSGVSDELLEKYVTIVWTKNKVIEGIKERYGQGKSLRKKDMMAEGECMLYQQGVKLCGGWRKALIESDVDMGVVYKSSRMSSELVTEEYVTTSIREMYIQGKPLSKIRVLESKKSELVSQAEKIYETWSNALKMSGISEEYILDEYKKSGKLKFTREVVDEYLLNRYRKGLSLRPSDFENGTSTRAYKKAMDYYGSLKEAFIYLGIPEDYNDQFYKGRMGKQELLDKVEKRCEVGKGLRRKDLEEDGELTLYTWGAKYFGGWEETIKASGVEVSVLKRK